MTNTIFAPITADINSPVAFIRISGPDALLCLKYFGVKDSSLEARKVYLRSFFDGEIFLDQGVVTYYKGPASFTGDDVVEIAVHGSRINVSKFLAILAKIPNFRYAEAGEFSKRAFVNGKIDLVQAEGINDLIKAETDLQLNQARNLFSGKSSDIFNSWREKLIEILSLVEAYIDFPDEELPDTLLIESQNLIANLTAEAEEFIESNKYGEQIRSGFLIAILGEPNAGKSTLLNKIAGRDVAITSNIAGTTRDIIEVHLDIAGIPVILADTAGIREAQDEIEKIGVDRAKEMVNKADLKILLIDISRDDLNLELNRKYLDDKTIIVASKADIAAGSNKNVVGELDACLLSCHNDNDVKNLLSKIESHVKQNYNQNKMSLLASKRHLQAIEIYLEQLAKFSLKGDIVLAAENLRAAVTAIDKIIGKIDVEEILGKIFSSFCIGK